MVKLSDSASLEHGHKICSTNLKVDVKLIRNCQKINEAYSITWKSSERIAEIIRDSACNLEHLKSFLFLFMTIFDLPVIFTSFSALHACFFQTEVN